MKVALVITGCESGSANRYVFGLWVAGRFGMVFPWGTLGTNIARPFLIGLATLADESGSIGPSPADVSPRRLHPALERRLRVVQARGSRQSGAPFSTFFGSLPISRVS